MGSEFMRAGVEQRGNSPAGNAAHYFAPALARNTYGRSAGTE